MDGSGWIWMVGWLDGWMYGCTGSVVGNWRGREREKEKSYLRLRESRFEGRDDGLDGMDGMDCSIERGTED